MILSIHQPSYFPWLGLLDKIAKSETFVLLDDVQVVKGTYQYRNIFYCNGEAKYLSLPINYHLGITFKELEFKNDKWIQDHLNKLHQYYSKTPFFTDVHLDIEELFMSFKGMRPINVLEDSMIFCFEKLGIKSNIIRSSTLNYQGKKGEMVLDICKKSNATNYIAGQGSYEYMQEILPEFKKYDIEISWHSFKHPLYRQHPKFNFVNGLSVLDLFFFNGYQGAKEIFQTNINDNEQEIF